MRPIARSSPIGTITAELGNQIELGEEPKGTRLISDVVSLKLTSEKVNATLATNDAADWLTISEGGKLGSLDVRSTLVTNDGAFIYVEYSGRTDMESGLIATAGIPNKP